MAVVAHYAYCNIVVDCRKRIRGPRPKKVTEGPEWLRYATAEANNLIPYFGLDKPSIKKQTINK